MSTGVGGAASGEGGLWSRIRHRLGLRRQPQVVLVDDGSLPVLGGSFDPARADSAVVSAMAGDGVDLSGPLLVRHHLRLPDEQAVGQARDIVAQDGYRVVELPAAEGWSVRASRMQPVTGLSLAQERSRMAALASRLGGDASGWDVCGPVEPGQ